MSTITDDERRQRIALKFKLLELASTDDRLNGGQFRFFHRIMQQVDIETWTSTIGDERITAEIPGCAARHTCNDHRAAIRLAGYFEFEAGSGRHPTRYFPAEALPSHAVDSLITKNDQLETRRLMRKADRWEKRREVVKSPRPIDDERWSNKPVRGGAATTRSLESFPSQSLPVTEDSMEGHNETPRCATCGAIATERDTRTGRAMCEEHALDEFSADFRPI